MKLYILVSFHILFTFCAHTQCTGTGTSLATLYNSDNSNKGVMFNIVATNTVTLICFDVNLIGFITGTFEIYYKVGTYVGSQGNAAAWTMVGSNSVTALGINNPTPIDIPLNIVIPAGQTYGFYITNNDNTLPAGVRYTNGASTTLASDANVSIVGGIGKAYPFGNDVASRRFNGTLHYALGNVLPVELVSFYATPLNDRVKTSWKTESEANNDYFTIERSTDGEEWTTIQTIKGAGITSQSTTYEAYDTKPLWGISYYRLKQTDFNGHTVVFDTRSVERISDNSGNTVLLKVCPNPASDEVTLEGSQDELGTIEVYSSLGENLTSSVQITTYHSYATIDISALRNELIIVRAGNKSSLILKN